MSAKKLKTVLLSHELIEKQACLICLRYGQEHSTSSDKRGQKKFSVENEDRPLLKSTFQEYEDFRKHAEVLK